MRPSTWILAVFGGMGSLVGTASAATPAASTADSGTNTASSDILADAVRVALRSERDGNNVDRNALLLHIVDQDPDFSPARWHLGYLKANEAEWVPFARFADEQDDRWHRLYLYHKSREDREDSVRDHFAMADSARELGMVDEERAHLMRIVALEPDNAAARARLGDVNVVGFWIAHEEVEQFTRRLLRTKRELDAWGPEVNRIVRQFDRSRGAAREEVWEQLTAIRDPAAIPAVEQALVAGNERAALSYLDWLRNLPAWEASVALVRQAIFSPSAAVRSTAQRFLKERRIDDYVPVLLGAMRAFETNSGVRATNLALLYDREMMTGLSEIRHAGTPADMSEWRDLALAHLRRQYQTSSPSQARNAQSTAAVGADRVSRTLAAAIQIPEYDSPREWRDWWNDYQQVYVSASQRELEEDNLAIRSTEPPPIRRPPRPYGILALRTRSVMPIPPPPPPPGSCSCFAAGTLVVTEYGPKPIEEIVLGDRVLAQDVDSGEIAFKPVFKTTIRPPVQLLKVTTEDGELTCTNGHPFWINGLGWRYAWELEPGMRFHSVHGSSEITSVEDSGREEEAYNLVVADFHDYFVGEGRILCHDNSPRNPTNALVPGLMPDWSAPVPQSSRPGQTP